MPSLDDKKKQFRIAVKKFINSNQKSNDFMDFIMTSIHVTRPDSGLIWEEMEEILEEELPNE